MSEFFDWDPVTGLTYSTDWDTEKDEIVLHTYQDAQPVIDHATRIRNSGENDKGIKNDIWLYAIIPASVQVALRDKGIDMHNKNHERALFREINTNFPHIKTTALHHAGRKR